MECIIIETQQHKKRLNKNMKERFMKRGVVLALCVLGLSSCEEKQEHCQIVNSQARIHQFKVGQRLFEIEKQKIFQVFPHGTNVESMAPRILTSQNSKIVPSSGEVQDFSRPVLYTVTAEDGTKKTYEVSVTVAKEGQSVNDLASSLKQQESSTSTEQPTDALSIETFTLANQNMNINGPTVRYIFTGLENIYALTPTIKLKDGASIRPASGIEQDFSKPVTYTITKTDGSEHTLTVIISSASPFYKDKKGIIKLYHPQNTKVGEVDINGETYSIVDNTTIRTLVKSEPHRAQFFVTSKVTDMQGLFYNDNTFNQPIGSWDMSQVTNMKDMFWQATAFNQPIGNWNVSKVTDMKAMFKKALNFNQPLADWDVSQVTNMTEMFSRAQNFNQPLGNWKVAKVQTMDHMFINTLRFNQDLSTWCVSLIQANPSIDLNAVAWSRAKPNWGSCP